MDYRLRIFYLIIIIIINKYNNYCNCIITIIIILFTSQKLLIIIHYALNCLNITENGILQLFIILLSFGDGSTFIQMMPVGELVNALRSESQTLGRRIHRLIG